MGNKPLYQKCQQEKLRINDHGMALIQVCGLNLHYLLEQGDQLENLVSRNKRGPQHWKKKKKERSETLKYFQRTKAIKHGQANVRKTPEQPESHNMAKQKDGR